MKFKASEDLKLNWVNTIFLISSPIIAIVLTSIHLYLEGFIWQIWLLALFMYFATGFSITAGYHRLFSHRSYQTNKFVKLIYLLFGAAAAQNSALKWCTDHRRHHLLEDTDDDPYAINNGFFWAHMGWVFFEASDKYDRAAKDLENDPLVAWQNKYYMKILILVGFVFPAIVGGFMGSALGGFAVAGWLRVVFVHHCTFFINSLCHYWGSQPYSDKISAKDNAIMALFTYGEGYHNFHHKFQADYRNGLKWYQFDPTKWLIVSLKKIGWAYNLKVAPDEAILRAKLSMQQKNCLDKKCVITFMDYPNLEEKLTEMRQKVEQAQQKWVELKFEYNRLKKDYQKFKLELPEHGRHKIEALKQDIQKSKEEFQYAYSQWKNYTRQVYNMA